MWDEGKGSYGDKLVFSGGINFGMTPVFGAFFGAVLPQHGVSNN